MQVIPAIDLMEGRCVRLTEGRREAVKNYSEDPVGVALRWQGEGAKRLHLVDLDGAFCGQPKNLEVLEAISRAVTIPIQFGGGLRSLESVSRSLALGASFTILGTAALENREFIGKICRLHPGRIMVSIDAYRGRVATKGWREIGQISALSFAQELGRYPLAGLVYTDVAKDGTLKGPNLRATGQMVSASSLPLFAAGGIATLNDVLRLKKLEGLAGMIIGKALYEGRINLREAI